MKRFATISVLFLIFSWAAFSAADDINAVQHDQTVIVVVGAGGNAEYTRQFTGWADSWKQACDKANTRFIQIGSNEDPAQNDRRILQDTLADESIQKSTTLWLVLIGHGTFDGRDAKFNLKGPDITAAELNQWLAPITIPTAVINASSSSAPFLKKLSSPDRIVITATKSGFEQNFSRFGGYLAEAIVALDADLDKDGQTSLLEAFLTASHRTAEFYTTSGRLVTEFALLDDNADGMGTRADWFRGIRPIQKAADNAELDGYRAHQFCLLYSKTESKMPADLRTERDRLELEVLRLRDAKEQYTEDLYYSKLQELLTEIAKIYESTEKP